MKTTLKLALAIALIGGSLAAGHPAQAADVSVGIGPGGVAFGFSDGYWDQNKQWHGWANKRQAAQFHKEHADHYTARRHDRSNGWGWNESNRWWDHR